MTDFENINEAIWNYKCLHGKEPDVIFVSYSLLCKMASAYLLEHWYDEQCTISYHGIPIKWYHSQNSEFYLAEGAYEQ